MVHPRGEVLSFPPFRFVRGEYEAADIDRLVALYRPLLPRPGGIENVALMGPLLYNTSGPFTLGNEGAGLADRDILDKEHHENLEPNHLEVLELYPGWLHPYHREHQGRDYKLSLWAAGLEYLEHCLFKPGRISIITLKLALLAAPVLKVGRKKREFHRIQMAHRAHLIAYGLRHLVPSDYGHITPSGGAMLLLDALMRIYPLATPEIANTFIESPLSQRNRNALYRRVNWLMEKYPEYRRAGYKGGEPAYRLLDHRFRPGSDLGWSRRLTLSLAYWKTTLPTVLAGRASWGMMVAPLRGLTRPTVNCLTLFDFSGPWLSRYQEASQGNMN